MDFLLILVEINNFSLHIFFSCQRLGVESVVKEPWGLEPSEIAVDKSVSEKVSWIYESEPIWCNM